MSSRSLSFSALVLFLSAASAAAQNTVSAVVETAPVASVGDAADDIAIWVHPTESELSLVIGTDKQAGLVVYDLAGKQLQFLPDGRMNNVDLRSGFDLGDEDVTLVTCLERSAKRLAIYAVDPVARSLRDVAARDILLGMRVYGCCMYKSAATGETYVFATSEDGDFDQWRLFADATGTKVDAELVRSIDIGSQSEGCVADDENAWVFVGEEDVAIWRYGAEPGAGDARVAVDVAGVTGHLDADIEGLALYAGPNNTGYLVASSQGNDSYVVYDRLPPHAHRLTFSIGDNPLLDIDGVGDTDGIDVANLYLGPRFPGGVFIAQDGTNTGGNQNFKFVDWRDIAAAATPHLLVNPFNDEGDALCEQAGGSYRFGSGTNPFVLQATDAPALGATWRAFLDCPGASTGAGYLFLFARPSQGHFVEAGELLVDLRSLRFLTLARGDHGGPMTFDVTLPPDLLLCGIHASCQALCLGTPTPALSNAIDLVIGR